MQAEDAQTVLTAALPETRLGTNGGEAGTGQ